MERIQLAKKFNRRPRKFFDEQGRKSRSLRQHEATCMRDDILDSIRSRKITTFQHLTADVPRFWGELGMFSPMSDAIIIWHACSEEAIATLGSLIGDKAIKMHPAPNVSYLATNDLPPCAVSRDVADLVSDTSEIRWFPVVFTEPSVLSV